MAQLVYSIEIGPFRHSRLVRDQIDARMLKWPKWFLLKKNQIGPFWQPFENRTNCRTRRTIGVRLVHGSLLDRWPS